MMRQCPNCGAEVNHQSVCEYCRTAPNSGQATASQPFAGQSAGATSFPVASTLDDATSDKKKISTTWIIVLVILGVLLTCFALCCTSAALFGNLDDLDSVEMNYSDLESANVLEPDEQLTSQPDTTVSSRSSFLYSGNTIIHTLEGSSLSLIIDRSWDLDTQDEAQVTIYPFGQNNPTSGAFIIRMADFDIPDFDIETDGEELFEGIMIGMEETLADFQQLSPAQWRTIGAELVPAIESNISTTVAGVPLEGLVAIFIHDQKLFSATMLLEPSKLDESKEAVDDFLNTQIYFEFNTD